jgi:uncharacterized protein YgiM (DUF1202 family)
MKLTWFVFFGLLFSMTLQAQQVTNAPPAAPLETPSPGAALTNVGTAPTSAPAAKKKSPTRRKTPAAAKIKDPSAELKTVPLVPGPAVVDANHVNVRGQAKLKSEVVTRLDKGQPVTVLEEIVRNNSAADEPSAWAKVLLPTNAHVWVNLNFIDSTNKAVLPRKLNLRSGPGENYSVLGQLTRGDQVKEINVKGPWMEIEAPTNAFAFIAAQFLKQSPPGTAPVASAQPVSEPSSVTEPPTVAAAPTEPPTTTAAPTEPPMTAPAEPSADTNALASTTSSAPPTTEEPPPKRIIQREGVVRGTVSIQAPTHFGLYSLDNGRLMDYLYTTSPNLDLRRYKGLHIIVTGEEGLEERWGNTPVITIQKIQTLDE